MSSKNGIVIKGTMDFQSIITFLEDVVNSFKAKTVCVQRGDEFITLTPADSIEMELEAVEKKGKQKLSLELEWREETPVEAGVPFKVGCEVPEPAPVEEPAADAPTETPEAAVAPEAAADEKSKTVIKQPEAGLGTAAAEEAKGAKEKAKAAKGAKK